MKKMLGTFFVSLCLLFVFLPATAYALTYASSATGLESAINSGTSSITFGCNISNSGDLTIPNGYTGTINLHGYTYTGHIIIDSGATVTITNGSIVGTTEDGAITVNASDANLTLSGTVSVTNGITLTNSASLAVNANADVTLWGDMSIGSTEALSLGSGATLTVMGDLTSSGALSLADDATLNIYGDFTYDGGGVNMTGSSAIRTTSGALSADSSASASFPNTVQNTLMTTSPAIAAAILSGLYDTITLAGNITDANITIASGETITLNLNGYTMSGTGDYTISNEGTLTINGGTSADDTTRTGGITNSGGDYAIYSQNGALTVNNTSVSIASSSTAYAIYATGTSGGSVTVNNTAVSASASGAAYAIYTAALASGTLSATITDSAVSATSTAGDAVAIKLDGSGTNVIEDCTISASAASGNSAYAISQGSSAGALTLKGSIEMTGDVLNESTTSLDTSASVTVDGDFTNTGALSVAGGATLNVLDTLTVPTGATLTNGGTIGASTTDIDDGTTQTESGGSIFQTSMAVYDYETLAAAIDVAEASGLETTITMSNDFDVGTNAITLGEGANIILNLNGYTLSSQESNGMIEVEQADTHLTVYGGTQDNPAAGMLKNTKTGDVFVLDASTSSISVYDTVISASYSYMPDRLYIISATQGTLTLADTTITATLALSGYDVYAVYIKSSDAENPVNATITDCTFSTSISADNYSNDIYALYVTGENAANVTLAGEIAVTGAVTTSAAGQSITLAEGANVTVTGDVTSNGTLTLEAGTTNAALAVSGTLSRAANAPLTNNGAIAVGALEYAGAEATVADFTATGTGYTGDGIITFTHVTVDNDEDLAAAITDAGRAATTITLGGDISTDATIAIAASQAITLDLAGYTLSSSAATAISNAGTLTINDSGRSVTTDLGGGTAITTTEYGAINATYTGSETSYVIYAAAGNTLTLNDVAIIATSESEDSTSNRTAYGICADASTTTNNNLTVNGGSIQVTSTNAFVCGISITGEDATYYPNIRSSLSLDGTEITVSSDTNSATGVYTNTGTFSSISMTDTTIDASSEGGSANAASIPALCDEDIIITGCTFEAEGVSSTDLQAFSNSWFSSMVVTDCTFIATNNGTGNARAFYDTFTSSGYERDLTLDGCTITATVTDESATAYAIYQNSPSSDPLTLTGTTSITGAICSYSSTSGEIVVADGAYVTVNGDVTIKNTLTLGAGSTLLVTGDLSNYGTITINSGATLTVDGTINDYGILTNNGTLSGTINTIAMSAEAINSLISAAYAEGEDEITVEVGCNITTGIAISSSSSVNTTLNLNGYSITSTNTKAINAYGTLTINGGTRTDTENNIVSGAIISNYANTSSSYGIYVDIGSTLTVNNTEITVGESAGGASYGVYAYTNSPVTLNGVTITATNSTKATYGVYIVTSNVNVNVTGGTAITATSDSGTAYGIYVAYTTATDVAIELEDTVAITGAVMTRGTGQSITLAEGANVTVTGDVTSKGTLTLEEGTTTTADAALTVTGTLSLAAGSTLVNDGAITATTLMYSDSEIAAADLVSTSAVYSGSGTVNGVAASEEESTDVGNVVYDEEGLTAAFGTANESDDATIITLGNDITVSTGLTIASGADITLNLNGYTISSTASTAISNAGNLTINAGTRTDDDGNAYTGSIDVTASETSATNAYGINATDGTLTINDVVLNVSCNATYTHGIYVSSGASLTTNNMALTVAVSGAQTYGIDSDGSLSVNGGTISSSGSTVYGINATNGSFSMDGAEITATSTTSSARGVYAFSNLSSATIANSTISASSESSFAWAVDTSAALTMTNCEISATSGGAGTATAFASMVSSNASGTLTVSGSTLTATNTGTGDAKAVDEASGIALTLDTCTLIASATDDDNAYAIATNMAGDGIVIMTGTINATGMVETVDSGSNSSITVAADADVTVTGDITTASSLSLAEGATLDVTGDVTSEDELSLAEGATLTVSGTLTLAASSTLSNSGTIFASSVTDNRSDDTDTTNDGITLTNVEIDSYDDLAAAITAAGSTATTITLTDDITAESNTLTFGSSADITLNLAGYTISSSAATAISNAGTLTINGGERTVTTSDGEGQGTETTVHGAITSSYTGSEDAYAIYTDTSSTLTVNGVDITATIASDGTTTYKKAYGIYVAANYAYTNSTTVSGGSITVNSTGLDANGLYIYTEGGGTALSSLTVNDVVIKATSTSGTAYGLYTGTGAFSAIAITDSNITAESDAGETQAVSINATCDDISVSGCTVYASSNSASAATAFTNSFKSGMTLTNCSLSAKNIGTGSAYAFNDVFLIYNTTDVTLSGCTLKAEVTSTSATPYAIRLNTNNGDTFTLAGTTNITGNIASYTTGTTYIVVAAGADVTVNGDFAIKNALTLMEDTTEGSDTTLYVSGTLSIPSGASIVNNGAITANALVYDSDTITAATLVSTSAVYSGSGTVNGVATYEGIDTAEELATAITNAGSNETTIELSGNITDATETFLIDSSANIILDLNGYTISGAVSPALSSAGTLTITDSGTITSTGETGIAVTGGTASITDNSTVTTSDVTMTNAGQLTVDSGSKLIVANNLNVAGSASLVNNDTITVGDTLSVVDNASLENDADGTITVSDTLSVAENASLENNGAITAESTSVSGTYTGSGTVNDAAFPTATATPTAEPSATPTTDPDATASPEPTASAEPSVSTVSTADELVAAIANGGEISLANDITLSAAATITKALTLNGNGKTLSVASGDAIFLLGSADNASNDFDVSISNLTLSGNSNGAQYNQSIITNASSGTDKIAYTGDLTLTGCTVQNFNWMGVSIRGGGASAGGTLTVANSAFDTGTPDASAGTTWVYAIQTTYAYSVDIDDTTFTNSLGDTGNMAGFANGNTSGTYTLDNVTFTDVEETYAVYSTGSAPVTTSNITYNNSSDTGDDDTDTTPGVIDTQAEFLAALAAGGTITLGGNITLTDTTVTLTSDLTIIGGGYLLTIGNNADFIVGETSATAYGISAYSLVTEYTTVTGVSVTIDGDLTVASGGWLKVCDGATLTVTGTLTVDEGGYITNQGTIYTTDGTVAGSGTLEGNAARMIGADDDTDGSTDEDVSVSLKVTEASSAQYRVEIQWGYMEFEYQTGAIWNTDTHMYESEFSNAWVTTGLDGINNGITVSNHSNRAVSVAFAYEESVEDTGLAGNFFAANDDALTAALVEDPETETVENTLTDNLLKLHNAAGYYDSTGTQWLWDNDWVTTGYESELAMMLDHGFADMAYFAFSGIPNTSVTSQFANFAEIGVIKVTIAELTDLTDFEYDEDGNNFATETVEQTNLLIIGEANNTVSDTDTTDGNTDTTDGETDTTGGDTNDNAA